MTAKSAAFVTGGTGALGSAVVARLLEDGLRVAVTYRDAREWSDLRSSRAAAAESGDLIGLEADVTDEASVGRAVAEAAKDLGGLRILMHVAGGYAGGVPVERVEERAVRRMLDLNLASAFWAAKHVIPHLKASGAGRLLFVSSRGAVECYPGSAAYAASKAGLHALVQTLAKELRADRVTANAILPSVIDTAANRAAMPDAKTETWVRPEEIAGLLSFLASESASAISGALIPIYGRA